MSFGNQGIDWGLKFDKHVEGLQGENGVKLVVDANGSGDMATMQEGIDACVSGRGDVLVLLSSELVTSVVNFNKTGISVVANGYGVNPMAKGELFALWSTALTADPTAIITERCFIEGIGFVGADAGATFYSGAALLIGGEGDATPFGTHLLNCRFPKWSLDNRIGLGIEGSSDVRIENCGFEGVGANFDAGIYVQGAAANLDIVGNTFRDCDYAVVYGTFSGGGPDAQILSNKCIGSKLLSAGTNAPTLVADNWLMTATDTGSYNATISTLKGYGIQFADNHYQE